MQSLNPSSADGTKGSSHDNQEKKKLRNRLSQQAFRRRQAERIKELQSRVDTAGSPDSERIEVLQRENRRLRSQLVDVQAKMSRLLATVQKLNDSVAETLGVGGATGGGEKVIGKDTEQDFFGKPLSGVTETQRSQQPTAPSWPSLGSPGFQSSDISFPAFSGPGSSTGVDSFTTPELINVAGTNSIAPQIPNIWSFEYQMGVQPYLSAIDATERSSLTLGKEWTLSNSPFSDHIQLLQRLLKSKLNTLGFVPRGHQMQSLYQPVLMVLSMFNSMTRPDVMAWYAKTRFFHIIELTAWQLYPSSATFEKLHPRYRPTDIQMNHLHPRVIDWIPFPSIRDRCIQLHAANPQVDQIFCDAVTGYTVEALMSDLILGAPQTTVYIRVTDLITAMASSAASEKDCGATAALPAPDITTLFSSPAHARAAFRKLNMNKGASYYKIDPAFFEKYPELYDQSNDLTATGIPLRPKFQKILTYPRPLDGPTVETYRSFIDFSLDASNSISTPSSL